MVWSYALGAFGEPTLDEALRRFYSETVGPYWPAERAIMAKYLSRKATREAGYAGVLWILLNSGEFVLNR